MIRPRREVTPSRRLLAKLLPSLTAFLAVLLGAVPLPMNDYSITTPNLCLIVLFFWALHAPHLIPIYLIFILGLAQDILQGWPMGTSVVALVVLDWLAQRQRRHLMFQKFIWNWISFVPVVGAYLGMIWLLQGVFGKSFAPLLPIVVHGVMTIFIYPILLGILSLLNRFIQYSED